MFQDPLTPKQNRGFSLTDFESQQFHVQISQINCYIKVLYQI